MSSHLLILCGIMILLLPLPLAFAHKITPSDCNNRIFIAFIRIHKQHLLTIYDLWIPAGSACLALSSTLWNYFIFARADCSIDKLTHTHKYETEEKFVSIFKCAMISCCAAAKMFDCDNLIVQRALNRKRMEMMAVLITIILEIVLIFYFFSSAAA